MFLPFSNRAKQWEPHALALRKLARVQACGLLDPWQLATKVGLRVLDGREAMDLLTEEDRRHLRYEANHEWSGGVYPKPLPDGSFLCILNPNHSRRRCKITLMEEIVHTYLKHVPSKVMLEGDGLQFRDYDGDQEKEAYGIGAAALLPWAAFYSSINSGQSIEAMAELYEVTVQLIEYRIKITGAYKFFRSRQR